MKHKLFIIFNTLIAILSISLSGCLTGINYDYRQATETYQVDLDRSIQMYESIIVRYPADPLIPKIHYETARLYLVKNQVQSALNHLKTITGNYPESSYSLNAQLEITGLTMEGGSDELENYLRELMAQIEDSDLRSRGSYYLGKIYYARNEYQKALNLFRDSVSFRTESGSNYLYWLNIGNCEFNLGQYASAERDLKKALSININRDSSVYQSLAQLEMRRDNIQQAMDYLFEGAKLETDGQIRTLIENVLQKELTDEQLRELESAYVSGIARYLIEKEIIRRYIFEGDLDNAIYRLEDLQYRYDEYRDEINDQLNTIRGFTSVRRDRIGLLIPLSGALSGIGQNIYRGVALAVSLFRQAHPGFPLEIIVKDCQGKPEATRSGYLELAQTDQVFSIIGPVKSVTTEGISALADDYHMPTISPGCPNNSICEASPYIFRIYPNPEREVIKLTEYCLQNYEFSRFAIIYPEMEYGQLAAQGLEYALKNSPAQIVFSTSYPPNTSTFSPFLENLKDSEPDIILIPEKGVLAAQVAGQVRYQEVIDPPFLGTGAWEGQEILEIGGSHLNGSLFISEFPVLAGERLRISKEYEHEYGEKPDSFSLRAFEAAHIILTALNDGIRFREQFVRYLSSEEGFQGIDGHAKFDAKGHYLPPLTLYRIVENSIIPWAMWEEGVFTPLVHEDVVDESNDDLPPQVEE